MKPKGTPKPYRSEGLFSRDYLNKILPAPKNPDWQVDEEELRGAYNQLTEIYSKWISLVKSKEGDWRKDFINKVFEDILHFKSDTYSTDRATEKGEIPDYTFYLSYDDYKEAANASTASERFKKAIALGEAKQWKIDLDKSATKQRSPVQQIVDYLNETKVKWGILTNGKLWRLYRLSQRGENSKAYYEFDLEEFLDFLDPSPQKKLPFKDQDISSKLRDFKYFYLFFRKQAFLGEPCFLDHVKNESDRQQLSLKDDLENNVYRAVRELAQGFVEQNHLDINDKELIKELWGNSLVFLYRLLFVLYAESYGHLPLNVPHYRNFYSLEDVKIKIGKGGEEVYFRKGDELWNRLKRLFELINNGSTEDEEAEGLTLPAYNGGLFDPKKKEHQFLEEYKVNNGTLAKVIDLLAKGKDEITKQRQFLIYKDLGVTKLGGIYEGLLEHKFAVADDEHVYLVERKIHTKTRVLWVKESELTKSEEKKISGLERILSGELYLTIDKGERKGTGSYYTPEYIVRYIVEHTLGPLCDKAAEEVAQLRPDIEERIKHLRRNAKKEEPKKKIEDAVDEIKFEIVEPYLKLKVLDPAMGSGHFLVDATRYIGERISKDENVAVLIPEHAKDELYWMRRVVERSIFGVDVNYLAVELAKLALWLETFSKDSPLSFLDHHLRQGNSLIGASVDQLGSLPAKEKRKAKMERKGQLGITSRDFRESLRRAVASYKTIEEMTTDHITKLTKKEKQLEIARNALLRFREIGDVCTSTYFGNQIEEKDYRELVQALNSDKEWEKLEKTDWFKYADRQWHADDPKYFHWELEFPEVFFDEHGKPLPNPGFDAVIGNPPYVSFGLRGVGKLSDNEKDYYKTKFSNSAEYKITMYPVFMQQAIDLIKTGGFASYIVTDSFLLGQYFSKIRRYISDTCKINQLMLIRDRVFKEGEVGVSVVFNIEKENIPKARSSNFVTAIYCSDVEEFPSNFAAQYQYEQKYFEQIHLNRFRLFFNKESFEFVKRIERIGSTAKEVISIHTGVRSKIGQKSIVDSNLHGPTWKKGLVSGEEIGRYSLRWSGNYINIDSKLLWAGGWDEKVISSDKLLIRQTADRLTAAFDNNKLYHLNNLHSAVLVDFDYDIRYVLALFNSKLLNRFYRMISLEEGRTMAQTDIETLEQLPIRTIDFSNPVDRKKHGEMVKLVQRMLDRNKEKQEIIARYVTWLESVINAKVEDLTGKDKIRDPEKLKDIDELIQLLIKNRKKLEGFAPKRLPAQKEITEDFNECKAQIDSIAAEISETDRAIDRLIYKLYGLTPEEIEIVEGRENPCED